MPIIRVKLLNRNDKYAEKYPVGSIQEVIQHPYDAGKWQFPNGHWIYKSNTELVSEIPGANSCDLSNVVARLGI